MALLNSVMLHPPDGWRYLQKETQTWIRADIHDELVESVRDHRLYKGLTPTDRESVSQDIQRQICLGATKGVCKPEKDESYSPFDDMARTLSLKKIAAFTETLVEWFKTGGTMVDKIEATRRANICRGCPFNRPIPNCVCTPFYQLIAALIPNDRKEMGLFVCGLCGCSLQAKVLAPLDVVKEGNPPGLKLPEWCWQK